MPTTRGSRAPSRALLAAVLVLLPGACRAAEDPVKLGNEALDNKQYDKAVAHFTEALKQDPKNVNALNGRGRAYLATGATAKAIADLTASIKLDDKFFYTYALRGDAYRRAREYDKAIADYDKALALSTFGLGDPGFEATAYSNRGLAHHLKGDYPKAVADYERAIKASPKSPGAYNNLAFLLASCPDDKVRDGKKAVELARKARDLSGGKNPAYIDTLATAHAAAGDFDEAVKLEKELLKDPEKLTPAMREEFRGHLKLFEQKKPFRDQPPPKK